MICVPHGESVAARPESPGPQWTLPSPLRGAEAGDAAQHRGAEARDAAQHRDAEGGDAALV